MIVARLAGALLVLACTPRTIAPPPPARADGAGHVASDSTPPVDGPPPQLDPDGDDDPHDLGSGSAPLTGVFEKVGTPPLALRRICDLTPLGDSLYLAHANVPLGSDGATITRYTPSASPPFAVAFDWNRKGEPTRGGGAGQGFLRVHAIDGRLYVGDADSPHNGLGVVERGTESYVFVSDVSGGFAPARQPHHRVPPAVDLAKPNGKGAGIVPRAYHLIDVIKYRGGLFASTGSVPPDQRAWRGPSPGALHRASSDGTRWIYEIDYPNPYLDGVWRLTFMVRFRDRLYVGIQDYDGREANDYLVIAPPPSATTLERDHLRAVRITTTGAANTLRWWADPRATPPRLYWIAWARDGVMLRVTTDGDTWTSITLPAEAGRPTDVTRFRDAVVVLTERALWRLDGDSVAAQPIARIDAKPSPFELTDLFCAAPLAVFRDELYAGGQRGGTLWKLHAGM